VASVAVVQDVEYIDDSKGTNVGALWPLSKAWEQIAKSF